MSGGEYIQLKWNSHQAAFLSNLSSLRDKQVLTDVMLSCEEQFYPAHRLVLSSCSTYFSRALELTTSQQPVLMLYGIKEAVLEHLLMYMYDGQVTISRALLPELLRAGRWLGVKGLEDTGDLPPNLADNTSVSSGHNTVSHMAHLVTQIFSSMASGTDDVGELQIQDAESYTSEFQMDDLGDQQDIKTNQVANGFSLEREENNVNFEHLVRGEDLESSEQETLPSYEEGTTSENSTEMQILHRIELQPPDEINIPDENWDDNEVALSGRVSPCVSEASDCYSFEGWEEGHPDEAAVTANLKALQNLITEALHYREHYRASSHHDESSIAISPVKMDVRNSIKCRKCQQKFRLHIELKQHMRRVHNREIVCGVCKKSFKNQSSYEKHARVHSVVDGSNKRINKSRTAATNITSIAVEDLAVRPPRKSALNHTVIHHSALKMGSVFPPISLSVKKEPEVSDTRVKIRQHKPNKHKHTYTCAVCSKTFSGVSKETYLAHVSKHRKKTVSAIKSKPTKSVKCPYCPYKGETKHIINGHVKVHYSDLPFRCNKCLFRSSTKPNLTSHIKKKHPELLSRKQNKSSK
ncbi:unnamed protein product [Meganyctiphanes norvegica]|uniref:Uncharacterized protein n=1 Tax=Meganyctiphanes norvegica TaxID=48144 RepID=A0AAV2PXF3_MEGNR